MKQHVGAQVGLVVTGVAVAATLRATSTTEETLQWPSNILKQPLTAD